MSIMRVIVLIAAVLVWINIYGFIDHTKTVSAPLMIENLSSDLAIAEPITTVEATISGKLREIAGLSDQNLQFSLDASNIAGIGQYTIKIQPKLVPKHIRIVSITPPELQITAELISSKTVDVAALSKGSPNDKYSIRSLTPIPLQVLVFGAPSLLNKISQARAYVDVSGHRTSFSSPAKTVIQDARGQTIYSLKITPETIKINVEIVAGASIRNLGLKPAFTGELPGGFWVQEVIFDPPVAQVRGPQKNLEGINFLLSTAINLNNRRGSFNEQVAVDLPSGVEMVGENVVMARVIINSSEGTRQLDIVPQYASVTEGFGVTTITPTSVQVVVSGDPKAINQLTRSDVKLNLDLKGALSGTNQIIITPAMFSTPANIQVVSFTPDTVEVVLSRL